MRKSHLISLCILFLAVTLVIAVQAIAGPHGNDTVLSGRTATPGNGTAEQTASAAPTGTPGRTPSSTVATATPEPPPTDAVRPEVDLSRVAGLSTTAVRWWIDSKLADENDPDSRTYTIDADAASVAEGYPYLYRKDDGDARTVYLTFNMAYEDQNQSTAKILEILRENDVQAAFFVSKGYLESNPEIVRSMIEGGHLIGTRGDISVQTNGKSGMVATDAQTFCDILWEMEEAYQEIAGKTQRMLYYRPDDYSIRDMELAQAMGYTVTFRCYSYSDWDYSTGYDKALAGLVSNTAKGAILQLSATQINADILQDYITRVTANGYVFRRLDA